MDTFRSIHDDTNGNTYAVGTEYEADKSLETYYDDMVDDLSNFDIVYNCLQFLTN